MNTVPIFRKYELRVEITAKDFKLFVIWHTNCEIYPFYGHALLSSKVEFKECWNAIKPNFTGLCCNGCTHDFHKDPAELHSSCNFTKEENWTVKITSPRTEVQQQAANSQTHCEALSSPFNLSNAKTI